MAEKQNVQPRNMSATKSNVEPSLDHGAPSLVAMDNPDDSQLGTEHQDRHEPNRQEGGRS